MGHLKGGVCLGGPQEPERLGSTWQGDALRDHRRTGQAA